MRYIPTMAASLAALTWISTQAALADGYIYMYRQPDGGYLFTDKDIPKRNYKLIKRMGRPTASASCKGITPDALDRRASLYERAIDRIAAHNHLDPLLIRAIVSVESCYDAHATSSVGARGLMQLMPNTGKHLGISDLYDPITNLEGGMRYFRALMKQFSDNVRLALAAYNAGPGAVIKYQGIPPYPQTENYVTRVMARYQKLVGQAKADDATTLADNAIQ